MDDLRNLNKNLVRLVGELRMQFEKLASNIGSHISDSMTEEMVMVKDTVLDGIDTIKESGVGVYKFFATSFTTEKLMLKETRLHSKFLENTSKSIQGDLKIGKGDEVQTGFLKDSRDFLEDINKKNAGAEKIAKQQNVLMKDTLNHTRLEDKKKKMIPIKKGKSIWDNLLDFLAIPFMLAGAAIGAVVGVIMAPFRAIYAIFKELRFFELLGTILKWIPGVSKLFGFFEKIFGGIWAAAKSLGNIPIIGRFITAGAEGFMKGFSKLFWPIQIIMSIFDFVEGWQKSEGSMLEKAYSGMRNVFMKFFQLPVEMLEGAWNWVAKELGFEGVAKGSFMKGVGASFDTFFGKWIPQIWEYIVGAVKWAWEAVKDAFTFMRNRDFDKNAIVRDVGKIIFDWVTKQVYSAWDTLSNILSDLGKMMGNWIKEQLGSWWDTAKSGFVGNPELNNQLMAESKQQTEANDNLYDIERHLAEQRKKDPEMVKQWNEEMRNQQVLIGTLKELKDWIQKNPYQAIQQNNNNSNGSGGNMNDIATENNSKGISGLNFSVALGGRM